MKTLLSIAAAFAAFASASVASAHDATATSISGHYEWQSRPVFGPNKSNLPTQVRVWGEGFPRRRQLRLRDEARNRDVGRMHGDAAKGRERLARLIPRTDHDDWRGVPAPRQLAGNDQAHSFHFDPA